MLKADGVDQHAKQSVQRAGAFKPIGQAHEFVGRPASTNAIDAARDEFSNMNARCQRDDAGAPQLRGQRGQRSDKTPIDARGVAQHLGRLRFGEKGHQPLEIGRAPTSVVNLAQRFGKAERRLRQIGRDDPLQRPGRERFGGNGEIAMGALGRKAGQTPARRLECEILRVRTRPQSRYRGRVHARVRGQGGVGRMRGRPHETRRELHLGRHLHSLRSCRARWRRSEARLGRSRLGAG